MESIKYSVEEFPEMDKFFRRNLINSVTGFKSISLIGTINEAKVTNLAPFSQVFHVGATPALIGVLFRPDTVERHTLQNLLATGYYTLNHIPETYYKEAHQTSARYEGSEFTACHFTPEYSDRLPAPYVQESKVKIGMKFEERHNLAINGTILIIGSIVELFVPKDCVGTDGFINLEQAGSITCSGLDSYHRTQKLARLSYAKPNQTLKEID